MTLLNSLANPNIPLIADTSVAINLNGTGFATRILEALPNPVIITNTVFDEIQNGRQNDKSGSELLTSGLIEVVQLGDIGNDIFFRLVSGNTADTLDDGEAATIGHAMEVGGVALVDEKKARRICIEQFTEVISVCTVDIFMQAEVQSALTSQELSDAVFNALFHSRMRVLPEHLEWVIAQIGSERAQLCRSIPQYARLSKPIAQI